MYKFFDYLLPDLPVKAIGELAGYIRRFTAMQRSDIPVEGHMGVQVARQRIPVDATV